MNKKAKKGDNFSAPISNPLRKAIQQRGLTAYRAAKQAGVSVDAVQRFLNDERGLTLVRDGRQAGRGPLS